MPTASKCRILIAAQLQLLHFLNKQSLQNGTRINRHAARQGDRQHKPEQQAKLKPFIIDHFAQDHDK